MTTALSTTDGKAFINAKPAQVRLVSERATSAPAPPKSEQKKTELRTETTSQFEIGIDNTDTPEALSVTITFGVTLSFPELEKKLVEYEGKHEIQYKVLSWGGFSDWVNVPPGALAPYLAVVHDVALRRAESTLLEMGLRGVALPRPETFDGPEPIPAA
jgi:hypothetical protein